MKSYHIPRIVLALIFALVILTLLAGVLRTFNSAHAALISTATANSQAVFDDEQTPIPVPAPVLHSADTTGVIALAIVIVSVILIGATWGRRRPNIKKTKTK